MHQHARKASAAAFAANKQGKYWEYSELLFKNHASITDAKIQEIAKQLGLDLAKFNRDLTEPAIQRLIDRDMQEAYQAEVMGTPTVFVNGKVVKNIGAEMIQMIEEELRKKK